MFKCDTFFGVNCWASGFREFVFLIVSGIPAIFTLLNTIFSSKCRTRSASILCALSARVHGAFYHKQQRTLAIVLKKHRENCHRRGELCECGRPRLHVAERPCLAALERAFRYTDYKMSRYGLTGRKIRFSIALAQTRMHPHARLRTRTKNEKP